MSSSPYTAIAQELQEVDQTIKTQLHRLCKDDEIVNLVLRSFFQSPGKRLRPSLTLLSGFALRSSPLRESSQADCHANLVAIATATELVHSASLMHDDVLDGASTRRGHPSLNAQFGTKIAILAGDMIYSQAVELVLEHADRDTIRWLIQCARRMCRGEIVNLSEHDFEAYTTIIADKTASLMTFCCKAGAHAARQPGDPAGLVDAFEAFGNHYGMMFQLADDLDDQDSPVANANREKTLGLLRDHTRSAERVLTVIPDSIYKAGLSALWHDIVERTTALGASHYRTNGAERMVDLDTSRSMSKAKA